jgi:hypothetical protein
MFRGWDNFYLMLGSAAAGLIGLLFVVVTLTAGFDRPQNSRGSSLYLTPTALNFALVLSISAVAVAPPLPAIETSVVVGLIAIGGLAGAGRSMLGIPTPPPGQDKPHWSDVWMYGATPALIYVSLLASAVAVWAGADWAAHVMAGLLLVLLLVSIRNAWDLMTFIAPMRRDGPPS